MVSSVRVGRLLVVCCALCASACSSTPKKEETQATWHVLGSELDSALIGVWGSSEHDVWAVGGDTGSGPLVVHWDGTSMQRVPTGTTGDLWWVFGFEGGPVFVGGAGGVIARYDGSAFTPMPTPGTATVFGLWGTAPDDMWAVGGTEGGADGAFAWHLDANGWAEAPGFPADLADHSALWKVWGSASDDAWLVGTAGVALHWDGGSFETDNVGGGESLFTVHYAGGRYAAVGGGASGLVFENDGGAWQRSDDGSLPALSGVHMTSADHGYAVGRFGAFVERSNGAWNVSTGPDTSETLHAVWVDENGGVWVVGGELDVEPLTHGVFAYLGTHVPNGVVE